MSIYRILQRLIAGLLSRSGGCQTSWPTHDLPLYDRPDARDIDLPGTARLDLRHATETTGGAAIDALEDDVANTRANDDKPFTRINHTVSIGVIKHRDCHTGRDVEVHGLEDDTFSGEQGVRGIRPSPADCESRGRGHVGGREFKLDWVACAFGHENSLSGKRVRLSPSNVAHAGDRYLARTSPVRGDDVGETTETARHAIA